MLITVVKLNEMIKINKEFQKIKRRKIYGKTGGAEARKGGCTSKTVVKQKAVNGPCSGTLA